MIQTYGPEADVFYVRFAPDSTQTAETREVADGVNIDLDADGQRVGVKVLSVKLRGVGNYRKLVPSAV